MSIPVRRTLDCVDGRWSIQVTDDGSYTLIDRASGDSMHSGCGALAETEHVYLRNSGVKARLEQGLATRVLEVGLGTGLGCLLTCATAARTRTRLDYVALENAMTPVGVVEQLNLDRHVEPQLIDAYCDLLRQPADRQILSGKLGEHCRLSIHLCDAATWGGEGEEDFDAIYFDPFSPQTNPELWSENVLATMHRLLKLGGKLVSYCVSRPVRDRLAAAGFQVQRVAGPIGGKREVLIASV